VLSAAFGAFVGLIEMVPNIGPLIGSILILAVGLRQSLHVAALSLLGSWSSAGSRALRRHPPHRAEVGLSPLVTLLSVAVVGVLFGGLAVILAAPVTSAVATS
jgi:predicted PurR-regulated permease PerM